MKLRTCMLIVVALLGLASAGCYKQEKIYHQRGTNFDTAKIDQIAVGQNREQVIDILGKPSSEYVVDETSQEVEMIYYYERNRVRKQSLFGTETSQRENLDHKELKIRFVNGNVRQIDFENNTRYQ